MPTAAVSGKYWARRAGYDRFLSQKSWQKDWTSDIGKVSWLEANAKF
jgi:hypothetical protein